MIYELPDELLVKTEGPVRVVHMNRPDNLNAINRELHRGLAQVWRQLSADRDAGSSFCTGAGRAFSAGGDFEWTSSFLEDPVGRYESLREGAEIIEEMLRFPLPVIAAVNGPAVGLGCSICLLSDIVLISEQAHLADPHVSVGLVAGDGGAALWPLLTALQRSREYLFTGDRIPAAKAVELGLATRTTPPDELMSEARKLAVRLSNQPAQALQGTKRVLNMHLSKALGGPIQAGFAEEEATMRTEDHRQRMLELRPSSS